jgi:hypothetical protein
MFFNDDRWITWNVLWQVPGKSARVNIESTSRGKPHNHTNCFPFIKSVAVAYRNAGYDSEHTAHNKTSQDQIPHGMLPLRFYIVRKQSLFFSALT